MFKTLSFLFVLCFAIRGTMAADRNFLFSFKNGFVKSPSFDKKVGLFGDSKLVSDTCSIQLTDSVSGSEGRVVYRKPIKLFQGKETNSEFFSTSFSFSMPNEIGDILGFVMVPSSFDLSLFGKRDNGSSALGFLLQYAKKETVVAFEFDISKTRNNRARILIGRPESAQIRNLSFEGDLMMNYGGVLNCMIEYVASSKRMLVRFRKAGSIKEFDPSFSFSVDLAKLWKDGEFMVGLSSVNGNSSKAHFLRSWSFEIRHLPPVRSVPLELKEIVTAQVPKEEEEDRGRSGCIWRMLGVLVSGLVCVALGVMLALYLWTVFAFRRSMVVVPEECSGSIVVVAVEQANK